MDTTALISNDGSATRIETGAGDNPFVIYLFRPVPVSLHEPFEIEWMVHVIDSDAQGFLLGTSETRPTSAIRLRTDAMRGLNRATASRSTRRTAFSLCCTSSLATHSLGGRPVLLLQQLPGLSTIRLSLEPSYNGIFEIRSVVIRGESIPASEPTATPVVALLGALILHRRASAALRARRREPYGGLGEASTGY
jgi:hypothetical protein